MTKTKKVLTIIGVAILILVWWGWDARNDYTWSNIVIEERARDDWVVGATQSNFVDIAHPWTIFKQPIVRIAFVKPGKIVELDNGLVFTKILWVDYVNLSRTEEDIVQNIFDCKNDRTAFVESDVTAEQIDSTKLEWRDNTNTSDVDIAKIVCK